MFDLHYFRLFSDDAPAERIFLDRSIFGSDHSQTDPGVPPNQNTGRNEEPAERVYRSVLSMVIFCATRLLQESYPAREGGPTQVHTQGDKTVFPR